MFAVRFFYENEHKPDLSVIEKSIIGKCERCKKENTRVWKPIIKREVDAWCDKCMKSYKIFKVFRDAGKAAEFKDVVDVTEAL